jgi:hypothetical protein
METTIEETRVNMSHPFLVSAVDRRSRAYARLEDGMDAAPDIYRVGHATGRIGTPADNSMSTIELSMIYN